MMIIDRLLSFVRRMIGAGRIKLVDDSGIQQMVQINIGAGGPDGIEEVIDGVTRLGHYGLAYCPPDGSEAVVLFIGGRRSAGVVIATGHRETRPKDLKPGEAMLFNGLTGAFVKMCEDGKIRSEGDWVHTGTFHASAAITSQSDITDHTAADGTGGVSMKEHRDAYNAHHHTGVTVGGGVTGATDHPAT